MSELGPESLAAVKSIFAALENQNALMEKRNEMLRESVDQQKESFASHEEHQAASLEALETPRQLEEMKQLFAHALELWSCDVGKCEIPLRFRQLQELLPDPIWEDEQLDDPTEQVVGEILAERHRQVSQEGWNTDRDDRVHSKGQLALAAACYAASATKQGGDIVWPNQEPVWPWAASYDKRGKHGERRQLVIAAALIVAEIERLDRKNAPPVAEIERLERKKALIVAEIERLDRKKALIVAEIERLDRKNGATR